MNADKIGKLTDAQRVVLRLWHEHKSAKEIGREIGITHWAVNERLRAARRLLNASSTKEAAKLLAAAESVTYNRVVCDPEAIAAGARGGAASPPIENAEHSKPGAYLLREDRLPFVVPQSPWSRLPLPRSRGDRNDLTITARLLWIGALAAGIVVMVGALVSIGSGAGRVVSHIVHGSS